MSWVIRNLNGQQWGREEYPTKEAADKELRAFFKGVSGVDLKKFSIEERSHEAATQTQLTALAR